MGLGEHLTETNTDQELRRTNRDDRDHLEAGRQHSTTTPRREPWSVTSALMAMR